jgi:hypothetical protein
MPGNSADIHLISLINIGTTDINRVISFCDTVPGPLVTVSRFSAQNEHGKDCIKSLTIGPYSSWAGRSVIARDRSETAVVGLGTENRQVESFCHAVTPKAGAVDDGVPVLRPEYHSEHICAYFRDLDRNTDCVCSHWRMSL